jgi:alginate O-acetyltransferase complex protein AlgJ
MKKVKILFITLFFFILIASPIAQLAGYKWEYNEPFKGLRENQRVKYQKIEWSFTGLKKYFSNFDIWYRDNFGFQRQYNFLHSIIYFKFGISHKPNSSIMGKEGFLFAGNGLNHVVDNYTGKTEFSQNELELFEKSFYNLKEYLAKEGIDFYFVIPPDKISVYLEFLPDYIQKLGPSPLEKLSEFNQDQQLIDLTDTLICAKNKYGNQLYQKTDTHWSLLGSYIGFRKLMSQIEKKHPEISPFRLDSFTVTQSLCEYDLSYVLGLNGFMEDFKFHPLFINKLDSLFRVNFNGDTISFSQFELIGVRDECVIVNKNKPLKVILIKDSFSNYWSGYFNQTFGKNMFLHYDNERVKDLPAIIQSFKPNIVVYEMNERYIKDFPGYSKRMLAEFTFNQLEQVICLTGNDLVNSAITLRNINPTNNSNQFEFETNEGKSSIFFKPIERLRGDFMSVKIEITSPDITFSQFYWNTVQNPEFCEKNVKRFKLNKGFNRIYLEINSTGLKNEIRFDPGYVKGHYVLHNFEIRK